MKNIDSKTLTIIAGGISTFNGYLSIANLVEYMNNKSVVLQRLISEKPEITEEVYQIVEKASKDIVGISNLSMGLFCGTIAGITAGAMIYSACRINAEK